MAHKNQKAQRQASAPLFTAPAPSAAATQPHAVMAHKNQKAQRQASAPLFTAAAPFAATQPHAVDLEKYDGSYRQVGTGEVFQLQVVEDDPLGKTHKLKNEIHFWEGSEGEFRTQFEKE